MSTAVLEKAPPEPTNSAFRFYEVVNGQKREKPPMGALAGTIASLLTHYLSNFVMQHRMGLVLSEVLFNLRPGQPQRRPDVAFVATDRRPVAATGEDPAAFDAVPNLAIEVVSPTNSAAEIHAKMLEYFAAGVQSVWVVYPIQQSIQVYDSPKQSRVLGRADELDGGSVLPGFRLSLRELFESAGV